MHHCYFLLFIAAAGVCVCRYIYVYIYIISVLALSTLFPHHSTHFFHLFFGVSSLSISLFSLLCVCVRPSSVFPLTQYFSYPWMNAAHKQKTTLERNEMEKSQSKL